MLGISRGKAKHTSPRVGWCLIVTILSKLKTDASPVIFFFFLSLELWGSMTVRLMNQKYLYQSWIVVLTMVKNLMPPPLLRSMEVVGSCLN